jgi:hypothetical protein
MKKSPKTAQPKPAKRKFVAEREILIKHLAPRIVAFLAEIKREKEAKERQSIPRLET